MLVRRILATLALTSVIAACSSDGPSDPNTQPETVTQTIDVSNVFAQQSLSAGDVVSADKSAGLQSLVEIRRIRLTVYGVPSGSVLFQQVYDVDPTKSSWTVGFTVPKGSTVRLVAELISVTNGVDKVEYSGQAGPVTINPCSGACAPIPIQTFPGPVTNLDATSVTISSRTPEVAEGSTVTLNASVLPAGPAYQPVWSSLNTSIATVSQSGVVTGVTSGSTRIVVAVGQRRDTVNLTVTAVPLAIAISAGNGQTATAGTTVTTPPSVLVTRTTAQGTTPVAGASVVFAVASGGGSITGATATTNAQGIATVGSWTLGATAGANTLSATLAGTSTSVSFTATATAPAVPVSITIQGGSGQSAAAGAAVAVAPSVRVLDGNGNAVANVAVTFEVTTGGGSVTGASTTTNAQGIATVGSWTLGTAGAQSLTARAGALSVVIAATANGPAGTCVVTPYTLGATVNAAWTSGDCPAASGSGRVYDQYEFTITQQSAFRAQVTGALGRRISLRRSGTQDYVQVMASETFMPSSQNPLEVRYVLRPGSYVFEVANPDATTLGNYTLATSFDASASCNPLVFVTLGVTINEQLSSSDCNGAFGGKEDWFLVLPNAGERFNLSLAGTGIAPVLVLRDDRLGPASPTLSSDVRLTVGDTARVGYTSTFGGFHEIVVNNATAALGAYTLTIGTGQTANTCAPVNTRIGSRTMGVWETNECTGPNGIVDRYPFTLTGQTAFTSTLASTVAPKFTGVFAGNAEVLEFIKSSAGDMVVNWFLAPGSYELRASAATTNAGSSYTLSTATSNGSLGCATNATSGNYTFSNQSLSTTDCVIFDRYEDRVSLLVEAGKEIVLEMTAAFPHSAIIRDPASPAGTILTRNETGSGSATATWRATYTGYYQIIFSTPEVLRTGNYSGSVTVRQ